MDAPEWIVGEHSYNSDPDVFVDGNSVYVINRPRYVNITNKKAKESIYMIKGELSDESVKIVETSHFRDIKGGSPCLNFHQDRYVLFVIEPIGSWLTGRLNKNGKIKFIVSETIDGLKENEQWENVSVHYPENYYPWHLSVFTYQGRMYAVVTCVKDGVDRKCWNFLGEFSENLKDLHIYKTLLTDYESYRSAGCVREDGEFVLYNTTVGEKIKGGMSVDGREVVMAHCRFEDMLTELRQNENM